MPSSPPMRRFGALLAEGTEQPARARKLTQAGEVLDEQPRGLTSVDALIHAEGDARLLRPGQRVAQDAS